MARRRKPKLDPQDLALWDRVAATVDPLRSRPRAAAARAPEPAPGPAPPPPAAEPVQPPRAATAAPYSPPMSQPGGRPGPAPLDRKLKRRLDRGQRRAEAVIDLHGLTQRVAHDRLLGFLRVSQARGLRVVLVVTGKGSSSPRPQRDWWEGPAGVLRRAVPHWLETQPFRSLVSAFETPVTRRGGEGALYVQIRRPRGD